MLPGPDEIRACPYCSKLFRIHTILSGNNLGARYWSDGKCDAPMLPEYPAVARCPHCRSVFWVEDTVVLGEESCFSHPPANESAAPWCGARELDQLDVEGYQEAIACNSDIERERFLRVRYWHTVNDLHRGDAVASEESKALMLPQHQANLNALLSLLREEDSSERIMKAEVFRELGQYRESLWLLSEVPEGLSWAGSQIAAMAQAGVSRVFELRTA